MTQKLARALVLVPFRQSCALSSKASHFHAVLPACQPPARCLFSTRSTPRGTVNATAALAAERGQPAEPGPGSSSEAADAGPAFVPKTGQLNALPTVAQADETLQSALKRAAKLTATAGLAREASEAAKARKRAAQQLNELTQTLAVPLGIYTRGFPKPSKLHPFERALLDLTVGTAHYEKTLLRVDVLRKATLECGKGHTAFANKATTASEAEQRRTKGFEEMEALFLRGARAVDDLKEIAKTLRALPVAELESPTVTLVGAPNVGKSSLVRLFSSGKPEVQNYPFTTRGIQMGHIVVEEKRFVFTDTPGVLPRPDGMRNRMERLTLATLAYLPVHVLFVMDLSGGCGTKIADQLVIRDELLERFPEHTWLDVVSKSDLPIAADEKEDAARALELMPGAIRVSVTTGQGVDVLERRLLTLLGFPDAVRVVEDGKKMW